MSTGPEREELGTLAEEAARLLGAVSTWARHQGAEGPGPAPGPAPAPGPEPVEAEQPAVGGEPGAGCVEGHACTLCPVCRGVHAVRGLSPEVRDHLAAAASSAVQALAALLATPPPEEGRHRPGHGPGGDPVERIDLHDNWDDTGRDEPDDRDAP